MGGNNDGSDIDGTSQQKLDPKLRFVLLSMTSIILAYINWKGLPMVGKMSVAICVISMSPFIIMVLVGAFKVDPARWFERPIQDTDSIVNGLDDDITGGLFPAAALGGILWRPYLNNLFWNLNSFVSLSMHTHSGSTHLYFSQERTSAVSLALLLSV